MSELENTKWYLEELSNTDIAEKALKEINSLQAKVDVMNE